VIARLGSQLVGYMAGHAIFETHVDIMRDRFRHHAAGGGRATAGGSYRKDNQYQGH